MASPRTAVAVVLALALASMSCRSKSNGADGVDAAAGAGAGAGAGVGGGGGAGAASAEQGGEGDEGGALGLVVDASNRFRDAEPKVALDPDGPVDPVCTGPEIALATAVIDKRCAIGSARAKQLRALLEQDGGASPLLVRQEAKVGPDGRVTLRLVNTGPASLTLPLSFSSKLPAFTVLAEDERHTVFELEAPRFDVGTAPGLERAHFARIVLPPGGAAVATITITPGVLRALGRGGESCADASRGPDAAGCAPSRLGKGRYVLHVGELLSDVEVGAPARVTWDLP
jgi:hypothetical protein